MYGARTYNVVAVQPYLDVVGLVANRVVVVDRNGIGIKHTSTFGGTQSVNIYTYEWYGVRLGSLVPGDYLIVISNIVLSNRVILFEFGPTPAVGTTYSVTEGTTIASYKVQTGDTTEDVRDALKLAIDNATWSTSISTVDVSTNRLECTLSDAAYDLTVSLGAQKYKKGRYVTISGINYIVTEAEASDAYPVLPAIAASYAFTAITPITGTVEQYLEEPLTIYTYSASSTSTTNITGIPTVTSVNPGECVVDEPAQRIWFDGDLNFGEIIKVFQK
jgi:hypothetical protein